MCLRSSNKLDLRVLKSFPRSDVRADWNTVYLFKSLTNRLAVFDDIHQSFLTNRYRLQWDTLSPYFISICYIQVSCVELWSPIKFELRQRRLHIQFIKLEVGRIHDFTDGGWFSASSSTLARFFLAAKAARSAAFSCTIDSLLASSAIAVYRRPT